MSAFDIARLRRRRLFLALGFGVGLLTSACAPYDLAAERADERATREHDGTGMGGDHEGGGHM